MSTAVHSSLGQLKREHERFGLMIGELDVAVQTMYGADLLNAIEEITNKYQVPVI